MTKAVLIFWIGIFGMAVIACDMGGNGGNDGNEVPEKYEGPAWTAVDDSPFGDKTINAIAYGGEKFVTGGTTGTKTRGTNIAWSDNGINWTLVADDAHPFFYQTSIIDSETFRSSLSINAIAYGGGKFVAGAGSRTALSDDGKNWTEIQTLNYITAIVYGGTNENSIFVAGDSDGIIRWSQNGQNWTSANNQPFDLYEDVKVIAFGVLGGTGRFIAVSESGKMAFSPDAVSWSKIENPPFGSNNYIDITYGGGKFVVVSSSDGIAYSDFGQSWTKVENSSGWSLHAVTYGNGMFVAVGNNIVISSDGITWTVVPDEYDGNISAYSIAYGNGKFVIGGSSGKLAYSN
jgi:hypothetical protein